MKQSRLDFGELSSPTKRHDGTIRADARLTRSGVFLYRNQKGQLVREWRPPDEVFKSDSLASLQLVPLTMDHPAGGVSATNARNVAVGSVGQDVRRDELFVRATVAVNDSNSVEQMKAGKNQLSCGYHCEVEDAQGVTPDGEKYDAIQRNIIYNHVAIVDRGRAGPDVFARMDQWCEDDLKAYQEDAEKTPVKHGKLTQTQSPSERHGENNMQYTYKVDGVEFSLEGEKSAIQALEKRLAKLDERENAIEKEKSDAAEKLEELQGKLDSAQTQVEKLVKEKEDAIAAVPALVKERAELERKAAKILGEEKADATEREIKEAVIAKVQPEISVEGKSDSYVSAVFDSAVAFAEKEAARAEEAKQDKKDLAGAVEDAKPSEKSDGMADFFKSYNEKMNNMAKAKKGQ